MLTNCIDYIAVIALTTTFYCLYKINLQWSMARLSASSRYHGKWLCWWCS